MMSKMVFTFKTVKNGILLEAKCLSEDPEELVFQEQYSDELSELEAFSNFLYLINENYGPTTSRYSEHRIRVILAPGDRFEGETAKDLAYKKFSEQNKGSTMEEIFSAGWNASLSP